MFQFNVESWSVHTKEENAKSYNTLSLVIKNVLTCAQMYTWIVIY